jgi:hypothetical protein
MEDLLAFILEVFGDLLLTFLVELLIEFAKAVADLWSIFHEGHRGPSDPLVGAGCLIMGAAMGLNTLWLFAERVTPRTHTIPGVSLVLAPLAAGLAMHFFGKWRREHGGHPTRLATYWGGVVFGFGAAPARFLIVGR